MTSVVSDYSELTLFGLLWIVDRESTIYKGHNNDMKGIENQKQMAARWGRCYFSVGCMPKYGCCSASDRDVLRVGSNKSILEKLN